ncbi:MAG: hypothetical protein AVO35_08660 [Candidatus Aegiribacteria sp. MLS_C]|nr:MAG: hypothetical protein AVO35_08660 [Candidatus Aegiribacteria sp. MLS_C]
MLTDVEHEMSAEDQVISRFQESGGMITDTVTGLLWRAAPDRDTDWMTAHHWVENLEGGGWRLPAKHELLTLYEAGISWHRQGPLENDGQSAWSDSTGPRGANAWIFDFLVGSGSMTDTGSSTGIRGFAVRAP